MRASVVTPSSTFLWVHVPLFICVTLEPSARTHTHTLQCFCWLCDNTNFSFIHFESATDWLLYSGLLETDQCIQWTFWFSCPGLRYFFVGLWYRNWARHYSVCVVESVLSCRCSRCIKQWYSNVSLRTTNTFLYSWWELMDFFLCVCVCPLLHVYVSVCVCVCSVWAHTEVEVKETHHHKAKPAAAKDQCPSCSQAQDRNSG